MPAETGNGLAMRVGAQLEALSADFEVHVVVVPVAGGGLKTTWAEGRATSVGVVRPGDAAEVRAGLMRLLADGAWRERLRQAEPLPDRVRYAGPALAAQVVACAGGPRQMGVHAIRAYLAPLAVAVAELVDAPQLTLDLDDDDEHLLESEGRSAEADAYGRILATFGDDFAWASLASPEDARRVAERHGLRTRVVPNSVRLPARASGRSRTTEGRASLLLVGNLTYAPNVTAAEVLAKQVLPRVRRLVAGEVTAELVGGFEPGSPIEALAALPGVEVRGFVADLQDAYARADVAVVPLAGGAGTRIKLLEAFAAGVPVVTTPVGAAGLGAEHGVHLLLADGADDLAAAVARVLSDDALAAALTRAGRSLLEERFSADVVGRQLRALFRR
jgi:glycosyltransferase involved in cell wall biosynthesis